MTHKEVMAKLFDFNATTYYAWKKQNRPIINLIDKYFTKEDLQEFIEKGSITSLDSFHQNKNIQDIDISTLLDYMTSFNITNITCDKCGKVHSTEVNSLAMGFMLMREALRRR